MARFAVGDLVRMVVAVPRDYPVVNGCVGTVMEVSTRNKHGYPFDYAVDFPEDAKCLSLVYDWQIAPVNPPAEPASLASAMSVPEQCRVAA